MNKFPELEEKIIQRLIGELEDTPEAAAKTQKIFDFSVNCHKKQDRHLCFRGKWMNNEPKSIQIHSNNLAIMSDHGLI